MSNMDLESILGDRIPGRQEAVSKETEDSKRGDTEKLNSENQRILSDILKGRETSKGRPVILKGNLSELENEKRLSLPSNLQDAYWKSCTQPYGSYPNHLRKVRMAYFILQNGVCYFCNNPIESEKESALDHDYKTKKVRGMAHNNCNLLIGFIEKFLQRTGMSVDDLVSIWKSHASLNSK